MLDFEKLGMVSCEDLEELGIIKESDADEELEELGIVKESVADSMTLEAGIAGANKKLMDPDVQLALTLDKLHSARMYSDMGLYNVKQEILRKMMNESPQDWVVDQPEKYHPGITHTPTGYRLHIDQASIPAQVSIAKAPVIPKRPVTRRRKPQVKRAQQSLIGQSAWGTPVQFSGNRNFFQNLLDHFSRIRGTFRNRVQSRLFGHNLGMAFNPQAKLRNLRTILNGQHPVLKHPYDVTANRLIG